MIKVLQVIDSLPPTSGGSRFVVNLCQKLVDKGISVELLLIDGRNTHFLEEVLKANIKVHILGKRINRFHPKYIRLVASYLSRYDLIHVHVFPASYIVAIASILNKKSVPIIFTEHSSFNRRASHFLFKKIEKYIYSKFSKVIAITPEVKDFIINNLNINSDKISIIINGVDLEKINLQIALSKSELGIHKDDILILMAARFSKEKDYQTLIKALAHLPDRFKLFMCGDGIERQECEILVKELKLEGKAFFLGNRADIYKIIKASDIDVLSSHYEGFGLSIVEAMAAKKPVIASNVPGMDNVVKDAGLLFEVGDDAHLAQHLLKLGSDENYYAKISASCFERAQYYSLETMVDRYITEYYNTINAKP